MTEAQSEKIKNWQPHPSQRGWFSLAMYKAMAENEDVRLVTADLGYIVLDPMKQDFPKRFLNTGASEQAATGICIGMALSGLTPVLYSITTFLLYRSFEWLRNYVNYEKIPVLLVGSGYGNDYVHDGITHQPYEVHEVMKLFPNIKTYFPTEKEQIPEIVKEMIEAKQPAFLCLRR